MAYAFLKALGCNGDIGTITVDLVAGTATATEGHKVVSAAAGTVEIESSRYPFCFSGDPEKTTSTRGVLEWLPFNQDLNRLMLVVNGVAPTANFKVTWSPVGDGANSAVFTGAQLAKGVNLAAAFLDNPFSTPFATVEAVVARQQAAETGLIKMVLHNLPEAGATGDTRRTREAADLMDVDSLLRQESSAAVTPVKHTIKIEVIP